MDTIFRAWAIFIQIDFRPQRDCYRVGILTMRLDHAFFGSGPIHQGDQDDSLTKLNTNNTRHLYQQLNSS
jgi:hypothetical protein